RLDVVKTQYTYYTRNRSKHDNTPLQFGAALIPVSPTAIYLGVALDQELRFREQGNAAVKKAQGALMALTSLARTNWGIPMRRFLNLVSTCVHPRSDYAAVVWHQYATNSKTVAQLDRVQRLAQRVALGAFRTTPTTAL
ncbi:hypothetical protein DL93DRAFT_2041549, partial [Clavulina sp. PMI_390]